MAITNPIGVEKPPSLQAGGYVLPNETSVYVSPNETSPVANAQNTFEMPTNIQPYSGLPPGYRDQLMNIVMPQLGQSLGDMSGNINQFQQQAGNAFTPVDLMGSGKRGDSQGAYGQIDESTQQALGGFRQQLQNYLKEMIPRDINQLANRGVLSSTVAENMLSDTAAKGARDASTRGYETLMAAAAQKAALGGQAAMQNATTQNQQRYNTAMQSALMRNNIPNTLAGLLQYGQSSQDPTVMYRTMAELLASL